MPPGPGARRALLVSTVSVLAGGVASLVATLLLRVVMARALDPSGLGLVLLATSLVTPLGAVAALGTSTALAQRVAERRARADEAGARGAGRRGVLLAAASGALAAFFLAVLAGPIARLLGQPGLERVLPPIAPVALGLAVGIAALGVARGFGDSLGRALLRDAGGGLLRVLGVGSVLLTDAPTPFGIAIGFAAGSVAAELAFAAYVVAKGWISAPGSADPEPLLPALRPLAATEVLTQASLWLDLVVLGALAPPAVVGVYGVARGLTRVLDLVRQASAHGYLPAVAAACARGEEARLPALHVGTRRFAFGLVWPALAVCLLAPEPLVTLLFGAPYAGAASALRLLAAGSFAASAFDYLDLLLVAERRAGEVFRAGLVGTVALVVLLAALVPPFGGAGTAAAVLGSGLVRGALLHRHAFRARPFAPFRPGVAEPAAIGLASLAAGGVLLALVPAGGIPALVAAGAVGALGSAASLVRFFRARERALPA